MQSTPSWWTAVSYVVTVSATLHEFLHRRALVDLICGCSDVQVACRGVLPVYPTIARFLSKSGVLGDVEYLIYLCSMACTWQQCTVQSHNWVEARCYDIECQNQLYTGSNVLEYRKKQETTTARTLRGSIDRSRIFVFKISITDRTDNEVDILLVLGAMVDFEARSAWNLILLILLWRSRFL